MRARRLVLFTVILVASLPAFARPAAAASLGDQVPRSFVVLSGRLVVGRADTFGSAVIFNGPMAVAGRVTHDAVAFNGDVIVSGQVGGNVTALNGSVTVTPGARVDGNVVSRDPPTISPGTVAGTVSQNASTSFDLGTFRFIGRIFWWILASVTSFLLGLLFSVGFPGAADAVDDAAHRRVGPSIGWGLGGFFGLPIVALILLVTVVGGLLGVALGLSVMLIDLVGYAFGAGALGRLLVKAPKPRFLAFLAGWGILRVAALIPVIGGLLFAATTVWGLGAAVVAGYRASRGPAAAPVPPGLSPPMPPMPSLP
jgi:hypothetical protein